MQKVIRDHLGYVIVLDGVPKRIVSLVPSQTELLVDLGLEKNILGITKFCVRPEHLLKTKVRVGGTKNFRLEAIKVLNPDIILANKEENNEELVTRLKQLFPVWISDVKNLADAQKMIHDVGEIFERTEKADAIISAVNKGFHELTPFQKPIRAAYLIWRRPFMTVNKDTFIHDMMERCGMENVFADVHLRYPEISIEMLKEKNPQLVILSSEPYPFKEKHFEEIENALPNASVMLAEGEMFSWYGSRLMESPHYFKRIREDILDQLI